MVQPLLESSWVVPQKVKHRISILLSNSTPQNILQKLKIGTQEILVYRCLQPHYSEYPKVGDKANILQRISEQRNCNIYIQRDII